jgi:AraC-like DNA-binding protein
MITTILSQWIRTKASQTTFTPQWLTDLLPKFNNVNFVQKNITQIARETGFSLPYFSTQFKKYMGVSAIEYLTKKRVHLAKDLLAKDSNLRILDISGMLGFENPSTFSKHFIQEFNKTPKEYRKTSKVNYSSERDFSKQKIYVDKDKNITKVEVLDSNDNVKMTLTIIDIDYKAKFDDNYFDETSYQKPIEEKDDNKFNTNNKEEIQNKDQTTSENSQSGDTNSTQSNETTSKIDDIVYPMYVPIDTQLSGQDIVETTNGERVILTFSGESAFTVVQETLQEEELSTTNYVYGDPYLILDTVGSITDSSVSWISNGIEYSVISDTMSVDELLTVAQSIGVQPMGK